MNLVLIGAPLSGKGTQAELLCNRYNLYHLSMGDIFREMMMVDSPLGKQVKFYMDKHVLIPDEVTIEVLEEKLSNISSNGILLDGFPRTLNQAKKLEHLIKLDKVIFLDATLDDILSRVENRYICKTCKRINTVYDHNTLSCKYCGGELFRRADDTKEIAESRFYEFQENTMPVVEFYKQKNLLLTLSGKPSIENIFQNIVKELEK